MHFSFFTSILKRAQTFLANEISHQFQKPVVFSLSTHIFTWKIKSSKFHTIHFKFSVQIKTKILKFSRCHLICVLDFGLKSNRKSSLELIKNIHFEILSLFTYILLAFEIKMHILQLKLAGLQFDNTWYDKNAFQ